MYLTRVGTIDVNSGSSLITENVVLIARAVFDSELCVNILTSMCVVGFVVSDMVVITIQYNTIQYNTIQYNTIQYNTIQYNTIQYNTIQ